MVSDVRLSIIITAHKEGFLLHPTAKSAVAALEYASRMHDFDVEILFYLDSPDSITSAVARDLSSQLGAQVIYGKCKDPGQSRLAAIAKASGQYIALLDGDDLWSKNWISSFFQASLNYDDKELQNIIFHPEYNYIFGAQLLLVRQGDTDAPFFDPNYFRFGNYWDALCIAHRDIFQKIPYIPNDLENGIGHEDYYWMVQTYLNGYSHNILRNTIHFKRRRSGSVSELVNQSRSRPIKSIINEYFQDSNRKKCSHNEGTTVFDGVMRI